MADQDNGTTAGGAGGTDAEGVGPEDVEVVDAPSEGRFRIDVDGLVAELTYRLRDDTLTLVHTGVPDELGGRGFAGLLVRAAVDRAERDGLTIAPWCPYARKWLEDHPDQAARVTLDMTPAPRGR